MSILGGDIESKDTLLALEAKLVEDVAAKLTPLINGLLDQGKAILQAEVDHLTQEVGGLLHDTLVEVAAVEQRLVVDVSNLLDGATIEFAPITFEYTPKITIKLGGRNG